MGLSAANKSPLMTPFCSGFPIDAIPHVEMSVEDHPPLIAKMQSWLGMLNWLQQCTRPDISTIFSLLASHMHCPSPGHIEAFRYVGRYLLSTLDLGLVFSTQAQASSESYIYFPLPITSSSSDVPSIATFCDANWGPQDASHPSPTNQRLVSIDELKSICGHLFFYGGCPILWKTHKERRISRSSCEAEVETTDECVKNAQMFRHLLSDLSLSPVGPIPVYNDNKGAIDWSHSFSTKGMRHYNIRENAVREAQQLQEVFVSHVNGKCNPADIFTKEFKSDSIFRAIRALLLFPSSAF